MNDHPQKAIHQAHDRYFRGAMNDKEVALSFIRTHLPAALVEQIDPLSLQLTEESYIEENLREFVTDVVYKTSFSEKPGYLYFVLEHQSSPDRFMPLRLHRYILQIIERDLEKQKQANSQQKQQKPYKLPLVVPHVVYNGKKDYTYSTDIFELFHDPEQARDVFLKPFGLTILKDIDDEQLKNDSLIGMVELLLKHAATRDFFMLMEGVLGEVFQTLEALDKQRLLNLSISYFFEAQDRAFSRKRIQEEFEKSRLPSTIKSKVMTIAESLKLEGREESLQEFKSLFLKQLQSRFPNQVAPHYFRLIEKAKSDQLFYWIENLASATALEDVFKCF